MPAPGQIACLLCGEPRIHMLLHYPGDMTGRAKGVVSHALWTTCARWCSEKGNRHGGAHQKGGDSAEDGEVAPVDATIRGAGEKTNKRAK